MGKRGKAKPLQDMRRPVSEYSAATDGDQSTRRPPDAETCRNLAVKHGFPEGFGLETKLEQAWFSWRDLRHDRDAGPPPTTRKRQDFLSKIAAHAAALEENLEKLGISEHGLLLELDRQIDVASLQVALGRLATAAQGAAKRVRPSKRGHPSDADEINLLCLLWRLYRGAFGEDAPRITRMYSGEDGGKFFEFADDVLKEFRVRWMSNNALGKKIQKAMAAVEAADARKGHSPQS